MLDETESYSQIRNGKFKQLSLKNKIADGSFWIFAGTVIQTLFKFIVLIVLARLLSPEDFGIVGAATVIVTFTQVFGQLGIGAGIVQREELTAEHLKISGTLALGLGVLATILVYGLAGSFAQFFRMDALRDVVQIVSLIFPITAVSIISESLLQREMRYRYLAAIETISYILGFAVIGIALAYSGWGIWALVLAFLSQAAIKSIFLYLSRPYSIGIAAPKSVYSDILGFGYKYSFGHVANHLASQMDNIVVGRYLGAEFLGYYTRAYQAVTMPTKLVGRVAHIVLFPAMSSVQSDQPRLKRAFTQSVGVVGFCAVPLSVIFCLMAEELVLVLLGERWQQVVIPFQILSVAITFRVTYKVCESLSRAKAALIQHGLRQWLYAIAVFLGAWLGHFWGLNGVAIGVSIAIAFNYLLMLHLCLKLISAEWSDIGRVHARHIALAIFLGVPLWIISRVCDFLDASDLVSLVVGGSIMVILALILVKYLPRNLSEEGQMLLLLLKSYKLS